MTLHNWFIPDKDTHKKAHLLSWEGLVIYIMIFIFLQVGFSIVGYTKPGILGITSNIDQKRLIELTNKEREKLGFAPVIENEALDKAASAKAQNMFSENYWAHFAPSGKSPWDFILGSGYRFTFAGENLAKNFYDSEGVVSAWMASKTHRENLLNAKYQDMGIAVVEGVLNGQKTTLVVQMFGTTSAIGPTPIVDIGGQRLEISKQEYLEKPQLIASVSEGRPQIKPLVDPYFATKTVGFFVVTLMGGLLLVDIFVLYQRGIFRISSHYIAHMSILSIASVGLIFARSGSIL